MESLHGNTRGQPARVIDVQVAEIKRALRIVFAGDELERGERHVGPAGWCVARIGGVLGLVRAQARHDDVDVGPRSRVLVNQRLYIVDTDGNFKPNARKPTQLKIGEGIERRRYRPSVSDLVTSFRQVFNTRAIVARPNQDGTYDVAVAVNRWRAHVRRHAVTDERRRLLIDGRHRGRAVLEGKVGRKRWSIPSGSIGGGSN